MKPHLSRRLSVTEILRAEHALLIVAHPDDEAISAITLLARLPHVEIVIVTNGAPQNGRAARRAGFETLEDYSRARQEETRRSLGLLGPRVSSVEFWGVPDQRAIFEIGPIVGRLVELIRAKSVGCILTHAYEGGHPDHDAVALAVHAACVILEDEHEAPAIFEMTSYHAANGQVVYGTFLDYPGAGRVEVFPLSAEDRELKQRMLNCYDTQRYVIGRFLKTEERFRAAPTYDFLRPPHPGPLNYESRVWDMSGDRWRRLAARALDRLGLLEHVPAGLSRGDSPSRVNEGVYRH